MIELLIPSPGHKQQMFSTSSGHALFVFPGFSIAHREAPRLKLRLASEEGELRNSRDFYGSLLGTSCYPEGRSLLYFLDSLFLRLSQGLCFLKLPIITAGDLNPALPIIRSIP